LPYRLRSPRTRTTGSATPQSSHVRRPRPGMERRYRPDRAVPAPRAREV